MTVAAIALAVVILALKVAARIVGEALIVSIIEQGKDHRA